jgi:hypothetical protein
MLLELLNEIREATRTDVSTIEATGLWRTRRFEPRQQALRHLTQLAQGLRLRGSA